MAPPAGSVVDHFGLVFKDLPAWLAKWKANGIEIEQNQNPLQGYVHAPDGIRVEFFGDPSLDAPVKMDHIHFWPADPGMVCARVWRKTRAAPPSINARLDRLRLFPRRQFSALTTSHETGADRGPLARPHWLRGQESRCVPREARIAGHQNRRRSPAGQILCDPAIGLGERIDWETFSLLCEQGWIATEDQGRIKRYSISETGITLLNEVESQRKALATGAA